MTRFGQHARWFEFTSDRFDHSSELPADWNAGNRFYGRDVAEFVSNGLEARGFDSGFFDEDWGWMVTARRSDDRIVEVAVYHNPEEDPNTVDDWALMVRVVERGRMLGFLPRRQERPVDAETVASIEAIFAEAGIALRDGRPGETNAGVTD